MSALGRTIMPCLIDNPGLAVYFHENRLVFILSNRHMDTYDSKTASRLVGVSLRQLQYWDEQDFIRPSVQLAEGRGTKRLYSFHDLVCLKVVRDLASRFHSSKNPALLGAAQKRLLADGAPGAVAQIFDRRRGAVRHYQRPAKDSRRHRAPIRCLVRNR